MASWHKGGQECHGRKNFTKAVKKPGKMLDSSAAIVVYSLGTPNGAARTLKTIQRREAKKRQSIQMSETAVWG